MIPIFEALNAKCRSPRLARLALRLEWAAESCQNVSLGHVVSDPRGTPIKDLLQNLPIHILNLMSGDTEQQNGS